MLNDIPEWLWPVAMILSVIAGFTFKRQLSMTLAKNPRHPQHVQLEKALIRFNQRTPSLVMLLGAALIWAGLLGLAHLANH